MSYKWSTHPCCPRIYAPLAVRSYMHPIHNTVLRKRSAFFIDFLTTKEAITRCLKRQAPQTWCYIPAEQRPQQHSCISLKICRTWQAILTTVASTHSKEGQ